MPKRSNKPRFNFNLPQFTQISESHCGPAVIQMLLSHLGVEVSQEEVAALGGATALIELNGMRVDQMAEAVYRLAPQVAFWYKEHASLQDLIAVVSRYHYPVGVEWQGVFEDDDDEDDDDEDDSETEDDDYGHYSIVTHIYPRKKQLIIADPYKDFISQARVFSLDEFVERWWDYNEVTDPVTGRPTYVRDEHMMFVLTPENETFPHRLGMQRYTPHLPEVKPPLLP